MLAWGLVFPALGASPDLLENFRKGANFGNYLEAPKRQNWGASYDLSDLDGVKKEGFDHIRLPVRWNDYTGAGPEFKIEPELFEKVDFIVTNAISRGLSVMVNIHHFDEFTTDPQKEQGRFLAIWRQISSHYAGAGEALVFELLNEPKDAATTEVMNPIYAEAIRIIRERHPKRRIFVGPGRWNGLDEVAKLRLPPEDKNLVVTVHCYDPFYFTHQGASWTMPTTATTGIKFPGPPEEPIEPHPRAAENRGVVAWIKAYNTLPRGENPSSRKAFASRMQKVAEWGKANDRPIHLGEFGAYIRADHDSRIRFYEAMRKTAEELGFGWCIWDWKAGFRYWEGGRAVKGMPKALFGRE